MFRFDFKDKSLIPPIFGTDNADYLERLCPVLERENIYPSDVVRYGICVACCDMAPTLRNFNRLRNLQRQPMPLTGEQERIVSSLVARPDNVRFPNVEMRVRIPAKRKGQGMNI